MAFFKPRDFSALPTVMGSACETHQHLHSTWWRPYSWLTSFQECALPILLSECWRPQISKIAFSRKRCKFWRDHGQILLNLLQLLTEVQHCCFINSTTLSYHFPIRETMSILWANNQPARTLKSVTFKCLASLAGVLCMSTPFTGNPAASYCFYHLKTALSRTTCLTGFNLFLKSLDSLNFELEF